MARHTKESLMNKINRGIDWSSGRGKNITWFYDIQIVRQSLNEIVSELSEVGIIVEATPCPKDGSYELFISWKLTS